MKMIKGFTILVISFLLVTLTNPYIVAHAEETETSEEGSCTYKELSEIKKESVKVKVGYDIIEDNGTYKIQIKIYNITSNLVVSYESDALPDAGVKEVRYRDTDEGSYTFIDDNIDEIYDYKFKVSATGVSGCINKLRSFTFTKPMRNKFYDTADCQKEYLKDYQYCKEWIKQEFYYSEDKIIEKIQEKIKENETTEEDTTEEEKQNIFEILIDKYSIPILILIGVIIILIIFDAIFIPVYYIKIRRKMNRL